MSSFSRKVNLIIAGTCIISFFPGCSKAPDAELAAARAALKAAQDVEADKYMSRNFENLQKAMQAAETEIAKQNSSSFLKRKYKRSTQQLIKITELATEIKNEAPKAKEAITAQVKENLGLVKGILQETANDIKKASRGKEKSVIEELKADLSAADSAAVRAVAAFASGNILTASEDLDNVQSLIKKITDTLKPSTEETM